MRVPGAGGAMKAGSTLTRMPATASRGTAGQVRGSTGAMRPGTPDMLNARSVTAVAEAHAVTPHSGHDHGSGR